MITTNRHQVNGSIASPHHTHISSIQLHCNKMEQSFCMVPHMQHWEHLFTYLFRDTLWCWEKPNNWQLVGGVSQRHHEHQGRLTIHWLTGVH